MKRIFLKTDDQENVFHYVIFVAENQVKHVIYKKSFLLTLKIWK